MDMCCAAGVVPGEAVSVSMFHVIGSLSMNLRCLELNHTIVVRELNASKRGVVTVADD